MALTKVTGGTISTTGNYHTNNINSAGVITATKFVGPFEGDVSGIATGADKIKTVDESADTTCFPVFVNTSTDVYQPAKIGSNLTFNSNTGDLGATKVTAEQFVGNISGTGATFTTGTFTGNLDVGGTLNYTHVTDIYSVGIITAAGNIQVGAGISVVGISTFSDNIDANGDLDVDGHTELDNVNIAGVSTFNDDITFIDGFGNSNHVVYDKSQTALTFPSGKNTGTEFPAIIFGDTTSGGNTKLYNDYYNTHFKHVGAGNFVISSISNAINLQGSNGSGSVLTSLVIPSGSTAGVKLYQAGAIRFETTGIGVSVHGEVVATQDYPNIRPVLDFNFAATKKLRPEMSFTRDGESSFHDGVGSVKFASRDQPRFEHDIITGECKGLMFEGAGTNYSWYSRKFDTISSGSWVPQNGGATPTVTANTHTAPDGTSSGAFMADTITGATGTAFNGNVMQQQHTAGANVKHTFSMYIKLLTATQATIYIRDGATGSISSTNAVNVKNWQRVVVTSSAALTNSTTHSFYFGNTNGTIAVWGSQIERSDYVSSYIKTESGANGTRVADAGVKIDGEDFTDAFNEGKGTLIAEVIPTFSLANQVIVGLHQDFGSNDRVEMRTMGNTTANARFESVVSGSSVVSNNTLAHAGINNVSKYGFAVEKDNYAMCVNGGTVATDTSGAFPPGINSMWIGDAAYAVDSSMIIKRIMYYSDRIPNSQLVTLTS